MPSKVLGEFKKEFPTLVRLAVLEGMEAHEKRCYDKTLCPIKEEQTKINEKINGMRVLIATATGGFAVVVFLIKLLWK